MLGSLRRVAILVFDDAQMLDIVGPSEVFSLATRRHDGGYVIELVAGTADEITVSSGIRVRPHRTFADCERVDTLIVAGGLGVGLAERNAALIEWLRSTAARSRRVASVCNGAFLLAKAGLLDGRRATTHWSLCDELQRRYPGITVESDPVFICDRDVSTSAGITAGMDLALALIEEDLGPEAALDVARWLVLFLKRPGGQSQFSASLTTQCADREPLRELQAWIPDHLDQDLSVPALAARVCMSPRNFARAFRAEVGLTPAAYVEAVRIDRARAALESTKAPIDAIARQCGFGTVETLRRAFHRRLRVTPAAYRSRFRPPLSDSRARII